MSNVRATVHAYLSETEQWEHTQPLSYNNSRPIRYRVVTITFDPDDPHASVTVYGKRIYENGNGETQSRVLHGRFGDEGWERIYALVDAAMATLVRRINGNAQGLGDDK